MQIDHCRSCASAALDLVLDLGNQPFANNLLRCEDLRKSEPFSRLRAMRCASCGLLQLGDAVPPVELFSRYLYFSSFSASWVEHARLAASRYCGEFGLTRDSFVVEIASNDGYLLKNFVERGIPCLGIEPAGNIALEAGRRGIETLNAFFDEKLAARLAGEGRCADLILANNVFAHAPETNGFVEGIARLLKPRGRVVIEFPYALELIDKTEFDTIYHEHVFYFSLLPLLPLFERHGLSIHHVERIPTHGGSLRIFASRAGAYPTEPSVSELRELEVSRGMDRAKVYAEFRRRVTEIKGDLVVLVSRLRREGRTVAAYGASAKGSTLMNFCGFSAADIAFVADRNTHKQGLLTPGTHIPIVGAEALAEKQPDFALLLTWNFEQEILAEQAEYRRKGGKFIVPIPGVRVV